MVYEISRREVFNNLILFKDSLLDMRKEQRLQPEEKKGKKEEGQERKYKVLLNRKTGDMRFAKKIASLEHHISRRGKKESPEDWKEIHLIVKQSDPSDLAHFEVRDLQNRALKPSDLDPLAWRIASETVEVLNVRAKEMKGKQGDKLIEEAVLQDLSSLPLSSPRERIEELPGWMGSLGRMQAEERLVGKSEGTYLLREGDEITVSISFHFAEENLISVHPYLLTVVAEEGKIVDILLLQTNKGWTLYHDDPNLKDPLLYHYFPSPQALVHTLKLARYPLG